MMFLLDVNLLFALFWQPHEHHAAAQEWFGTQGKKGWCTCATTELGFARVFTNPKINPGVVSPADALDLLEGNKRAYKHSFVSEDVTPAVATRDLLIQGYRQWTDAYLLGLCIQKRLVFVSFDTGLHSLLRPGDPKLKSLKMLLSPPWH